MNPDQQFWWNWVVNLAVAVATFLAVLIALFGQQLWSEFFPPHLRMKLLRKEGEKAPLIRQNQGVTEQFDDSRYYHLRVWNTRRRISPAKQVQVCLTRVDEPGPGGRPQVVWVGNVPLRWRNQEFVPLAQTIGASRDCDFCMVQRKDRSLSLMPLFLPSNLKARKPGKCKFIAWLQARSDQVDSEEIGFQVAWDGAWEDGDAEMRKHLEITEVGSIHPSSS